jgi:hypothetical protein
MEFIRIKKGLKITIDEVDKKFLSEVASDNHNDLGTNKSEADFFEPYLANSEFEWVAPEDIGALTRAPILGVRGEDDEIIEAYGYMDYQVLSMLEELNTHGEIFLIKG